MKSIEFDIILNLSDIFMIDEFVKTMTLKTCQHSIVIEIDLSATLSIIDYKNDFLGRLLFILSHPKIAYL